MPLRTITMPDGTTRTRMITNVHPDGTEFLPEEFTIPRNEITEPAYRIIEHCLQVQAQQRALEEEKKNKAN